MRDRVGLGWRPELAAGILSNLDRIDLVEVIADDFFEAPRRRLRALRTLAAQTPVTLHGVSLGLASINLALFTNPCLVVVGQSVTLPITQAALNLTFNPTACTSDGVQLPHPQFVELTQ